jgi:hypothetical protein
MQPFSQLFASQTAAAPWMVLGVRGFKRTNRKVKVILVKDFRFLGFT